MNDEKAKLLKERDDLNEVKIQLASKLQSSEENSLQSVAELQANLEKARSSEADLQKRLSEVAEENSRLTGLTKAERDAQHQKIESLEARILETQSESGKMLEALKEENAKNEADLKTAREHLEEASSKIHQLTVDNNERAAQHQKIESLEARILETQSESGKMLEALKEENAKNEADLKTAREHLEEASSKIHQLTVDNNFLVSEMEDKATAIELKKDCELYSLEESLEKMENLLLAKDSFCDKILAERDLNAQEITSLKSDTDRCGH